VSESGGCSFGIGVDQVSSCSLFTVQHTTEWSRKKSTPPKVNGDGEKGSVTTPSTRPYSTLLQNHTPHSTHPDSYETDPDPSSTTHCTHPHASSSGTLVQYTLMIDTGSTGSRVHTYKFSNCGPSSEYEYKVFSMTQPGLFSFTGNPEGTTRSLGEAVCVVPKAMHGCTPVYGAHSLISI
jgi:guanosine-diphosphatase